MDLTTKYFDKLSKEELYKILYLRQEVFVVEQNCPYQDADNLDQEAHHVMGFREDKLIVYARILPPNTEGKVYIGRIVTDPKVRSKGLGKLLMEETLKQTRKLYPQKEIWMSAQTYLIKFYQSFGFIVNGTEYLEDDIPHIQMKLNQ